MFDIISQVFQDKKLPNSLATVIINLIPKSSKDSRILKNLRPITLLVTSYKVIEKMIANRIETSLSDIINAAQMGFMKNRRIAINIRKFFELMTYADRHDLQAMIIVSGLYEMFDKIEKSAIIGSMNFFGFSEYLVQWVDLIYTGFKAKIQNNSHFTSTFAIQKGVHQLGPTSSLIFLLCAEVLAVQLRDTGIPGIPVNDITNLLGQFADDMDIYMLYDQAVLNKILQVLQNFEKQSGFCVSYDKTQMYRIGSLKFSDASLYCQQELRWTSDYINVLGIDIHHDNVKVLDLNYKKTMDKMEGVLKQWSKRSLSLIGKVNIINSLIASLFVYKMAILPSLPAQLIDRAETMIQSFLWNGHKPKIPLKMLQKSKEHGGLKLVDLHAKDGALKIVLINILRENDQMANLVYENIAPVLKSDVWACNLQPAQVKMLIDKEKHPFWYDVMVALMKLKEKEGENTSFLWYNKDICIDGHPCFWKEAYNRGLKFVSDLYCDGILKPMNQLCQQYNLNWMQCNSILSAISKDFRNVFKDRPESPMKCDKSAAIYMKLIAQEDVLWNKCTQWEETLQLSIDFDGFRKSFNNIILVTNVPKLCSFQYHLMHRAIITNIHLKHWKKCEIDTCSFGCADRETYSHLFVMCEKVQNLWIQIDEMMEDFSKDPITFNIENVLWNLIIPNNPKHVKNLICLITKQYIYRQRCLQKHLTFYKLRSIIYSTRNMEKYIAIKNNKVVKFNKKWQCIEK